MGSGRWQDIAYVAERVMTSGELEQYLTGHVNDPDLNARDMGILSKGTLDYELSYLLARRLMREGRLERARPYFLQLAVEIHGFDSRYGEESKNILILREFLTGLWRNARRLKIPDLGCGSGLSAFSTRPDHPPVRHGTDGNRGGAGLDHQ